MTDNYGRSLEYRIDLCVKILRQSRNLSQSQLARSMRTKRQWINKIEHRKLDPTIVSVHRFARAFQMSPRRFMELATVKA